MLRVALFFCIVASFAACDLLRQPYQLRGTGFSLKDPKGDLSKRPLAWTLNVGFLQDSDFYEIDIGSLRSLLHSSALPRELLPGLWIQYVIDQPLNTVFMMQRTIRSENLLAPKLSLEGPVLLLDGSPNSLRINRRKMERYGYSGSAIAAELERLERLGSLPLPSDQSHQSYRSPRGHQGHRSQRGYRSYLEEKLPASDYIWRLYMEQQTRYDLILTNAFIYPDDLSERKIIADPFGGISWRLAETRGRSGTEGYGALVSLNSVLEGAYQAGSSREAGERGGTAAGRAGVIGGGRGAITQAGRESLARAIRASLLALIFPLQIERLQENDGQLLSGDSFLQQAERLHCSRCRAHWRRRRNYLRAIYALHKGLPDACRNLRRHFQDYRQLAPSTLFYPGQRRAELFFKNQENFRIHCGEGG